MNHLIFVFKHTPHPALFYRQMLLIGAFWLLPEIPDLPVLLGLQDQRVRLDLKGRLALKDRQAQTVMMVLTERQDLLGQRVRPARQDQQERRLALERPLRQQDQ